MSKHIQGLEYDRADAVGCVLGYLGISILVLILLVFLMCWGVEDYQSEINDGSPKEQALTDVTTNVCGAVLVCVLGMGIFVNTAKLILNVLMNVMLFLFDR